MRYPARRGISMMEVAIGTLLVGGTLATTLQLVGPTVRSTQLAGDRLIAATLADDMLDEIATRHFADPVYDDGSIGLDPGEIGTTRQDFNDVDDYNGWEAPPQTVNGAPIVGLGHGWLIHVGVAHAQPENPMIDAASETGVKRVTVTVSRHGVVLAERSILRTRAFDVSQGGI